DDEGDVDGDARIHARVIAPTAPERNLWRVLLRLGELLEAQGEAARAARYYDRFIELWSDADDSVQPRVEAARARLQRLSG
ncbi:MAG TPA: hypothetical protein VLA09_07725, partial [Longimicrobiales bacterium]|nr:hypothetical protein [Longimicrobiales bacterium]